MRDWKGNAIDVGHTIKLYFVGHPFMEGCKMSFGFITDDGVDFICESVDVPYLYTWELLQTIKVLSSNNSGCMTLTQSLYSEVAINELGIMLCDNPSIALCIEGISDSMTEYYLNKRDEDLTDKIKHLFLC